MNIEEAKKMVGTEFIYVYEDGDEIKAYVKAFNPKIGLTCYTLETKTRGGWISKHGEIDKDGTWCVIGYNFIKREYEIPDAIEDLEEIKNTGFLYVKKRGVGGVISCAF